MSLLGIGLVTQLALALLSVVAAVAAPVSHRARLSGGAALLLGLAGAGTGALALGGHTGIVSAPLTVGLGLDAEVTLAPDRLGGLFMVLAGAVGAVAALYAIGYARGPAGSRTGWAAFAVFLLGLQLVPASGDVVAFLLTWELMAVGSTVLVLAEHEHRDQVRSAGLWYAAMTHLSFLFLLAGFAVLAVNAHSSDFTAIAVAGRVDAGPAGLAYVLLTLGFVTKAGLVPVHVWLPRAHPEAPSHVSAVMSAAMVKMGVYGVILTTTRLLPGGPRWWGLVLLVLALPSALYGILQASVTSDLKRLLAYSTTENVGLILSAVAVSLLASSSGDSAVAGVAMVAALMLTLSHAAFKTVLFLGAGALLHATGERDLDRLGGLVRAMPRTAVAFGIACLGAAALPVTSGFAAEWVLLQALIHGDGRDRLTSALLPAAIAVVALTAGLALLTFVKAFGIGFLARPRSPGAAAAHEATGPMTAAMLIGAAAVLGLGLAPGLAAGAAATALRATGGSGGSGGSGSSGGSGGSGSSGGGLSGAVSSGIGWGVDLPGIQAYLNPWALTLLALAVTLPIVVVTWALARRHPRRDVDLVWGGGGVRTSPRMQYTATSFAEPLVRVFDDALRPTRDLRVTHAEESRYLVSEISFQQHLEDRVETSLYRPAITVVDRAGDLARLVQNGSIHRYLAFSFAALLLVLVVVAW
ncbi:MAG: proton-conducting transporter membrane subunit [Lapillicoccus sp.]